MKKWIRPALIIFLLAAAVACGKDSDSDLPDTSASVRVYQFVDSNTAHFDFKLDTVTLGSNLGYGENTQYKQFRAQKYSFYVYAAGSTAPILGGELNLRNGKHLSALLCKNHLNVLQLVVLEDDLAPPSAPANARIRVVNLCDTYYKTGTRGNQQPLALDFRIRWGTNDTLRIFDGIAYGAATSSPEIRANPYQVDFNFRDSSLVLGTFPFQADSGKVYTLVTTGTATDKTRFKMWKLQNN
ncbi:DUF4397 domain-containing protein [Chitinophaga sp. GbtcB8]|uniref:DUF4397 domain-containing protein n=1 Tax=Chitinophaga sp. GbtcB8 TaxID=2824753 RepID=UPI001C2F62F2|nr:DUF4397 domain-containing protein [Chitinophaga sp. GbtcB8]